MDDNSNNILNLSLTDLKLFSDDDIELLHQYSIFKFGELLGATKGLSNIQLFDKIENGEQIISQLKLLIGEPELKKYIEFDITNPTGLIIDEHE